MLQSQIIFLCLILFVSLIFFIISSYIVVNILKKSIEDFNVLFYQYNKKSQQIIDKYGECRINKIYLIRQPFTKSIAFLLNILTFYKYDKLINESKDNFPYHTLLVCEIIKPDKTKKLILLEKNNCINLCENFMITESQDIKTIYLCKKGEITKEGEIEKIEKRKNYTLNYILTETQKRVGNERFFNWHLYKNNCHEFTKEILKTIGKYSIENKHFIFRDKLFQLIIPSEFTLHVGNCLCVIYNIIEKYIYNFPL